MVLRGVWIPATARKFTAALDAGIAAMHDAQRPIRSLIDVRELSILSVLMTPFFSGYVLKQSRVCDRIAVLHAEMLGRLQAKRLIAGDARFGLFTDIDSCEQWLSGDSHQRPRV